MAIALIIIALIVIFAIIWFFKNYIIIKLTKDNVICFTGGLGSGKTAFSVESAIKLLKHNRKNGNKDALLYTNIPVRISRKEISERLTNDIIFRRKKIPVGSVVLIDEVSTYIDNMNYRGKNVKNMEKFFRFYRHYTKGGYLIINDQSISNVQAYIRRRVNRFYILMNSTKLIKLHWSECITALNTDDSQQKEDTGERTPIMIGYFGLIRHYDTYCYSEKVAKLDTAPSYRWEKQKINKILEMPIKDIETLESNDDGDINTKYIYRCRERRTKNTP